MHYLRFILLSSLVLLASACANIQPMALNQQSKTIDLSENSLALFTVKTSNSFKAGYQPGVTGIQIAPVTNTDSKNKDTEENKYAMFGPEKPYKMEKEKYFEYLVSINLKPGKYNLNRIFGLSKSLFINSFFSVPVYVDFEIPANKVVYLGRIEANNRARKLPTEPRAGSVIPLIDQRVAGYAGGTFDVNIFDNFDKDIKAFKQQYPLIGQHAVEKKVLPARGSISMKDLESLEEKYPQL